jgi:biopolymer transport protein ExbD
MARHELRALASDSAGACQRKRKSLIAELSRGISTLKSIASGAPFLGLAGTCYGILGGFYGLGRRGHVGSFLPDIAATLVTTVAGLVVATPAAVSYNALRTRLERFESRRSSSLLDAAPRSYGFAQTLPLRKRFSGFPAFALIGAPLLGLLVPMGALMLRSLLSPSEGLPVHLLKIDAADHEPPIIISVVATNGTRRPLVYVNSKETSWEELGNTLRTQLEIRSSRIVYVEGGKDVVWQDVVNAIDVARGLDAEVVLLTITPNIESSYAHGAKTMRAKAR